MAGLERSELSDLREEQKLQTESPCSILGNISCSVSLGVQSYPVLNWQGRQASAKSEHSIVEAGASLWHEQFTPLP